MTDSPSRPRFFRFSELSADNVSRDFQVHTVWTDGKGTVREILQIARDRGIRELSFTEHARRTSDYYPDFFAEIDREAAAFRDIVVYRGFEVKIVDFAGALDINEAMRARAEIVLASVHSFPAPDGAGVVSPAALPRAEAQRIERDLSLGAIAARNADVMSHPGGMSMRFHGEFPIEFLEELIIASKASGIAFEINHSYHAPIFDDLLNLLAKHDPVISIGSDAHDLESIGKCRDALVATLGL